MILLLAGLFVLGVFMVVYALGLLGYSLGSLPFSSVTGGVQNFVSTVEDGNLAPLALAILVAVAVLGLILLILELKPPAPRYVRMDNGTYVTRGAVENEVSEAAEGVPSVLGTKASAKAQRSSGARVDLEARVRRGEDLNSVKSQLQSTVRQRLSSKGVPVSKLNVQMAEVDPRQAGTRVK
jgi:uncharacterized alkaline shock family protein YloU